MGSGWVDEDSARVGVGSNSLLLSPLFRGSPFQGYAICQSWKHTSIFSPLLQRLLIHYSSHTFSGAPLFRGTPSANLGNMHRYVLPFSGASNTILYYYIPFQGLPFSGVRHLPSMETYIDIFTLFRSFVCIIILTLFHGLPFSGVRHLPFMETCIDIFSPSQGLLIHYYYLLFSAAPKRFKQL